MTLLRFPRARSGVETGGQVEGTELEKEVPVSAALRQAVKHGPQEPTKAGASSSHCRRTP